MEVELPSANSLDAELHRGRLVGACGGSTKRHHDVNAALPSPRAEVIGRPRQRHGLVHEFVGAITGDVQVLARSFEAFEHVGGVGSKENLKTRGGIRGDQTESVAGEQLSQTRGVREITAHEGGSVTVRAS
jgi:hypothetical protein